MTKGRSSFAKLAAAFLLRAVRSRPISRKLVSRNRRRSFRSTIYAHRQLNARPQRSSVQLFRRASRAARRSRCTRRRRYARRRVRVWAAARAITLLSSNKKLLRQRPSRRKLQQRSLVAALRRTPVQARAQKHGGGRFLAVQRRTLPQFCRKFVAPRRHRKALRQAKVRLWAGRQRKLLRASQRRRLFRKYRPVLYRRSRPRKLVATPKRSKRKSSSKKTSKNWLKSRGKSGIVRARRQRNNLSKSRWHPARRRLRVNPRARLRRRRHPQFRSGPKRVQRLGRKHFTALINRYRVIVYFKTIRCRTRRVLPTLSAKRWKQWLPCAPRIWLKRRTAARQFLKNVGLRRWLRQTSFRARAIGVCNSALKAPMPLTVSGRAKLAPLYCAAVVSRVRTYRVRRALRRLRARRGIRRSRLRSRVRRLVQRRRRRAVRTVRRYRSIRQRRQRRNLRRLPWWFARKQRRWRCMQIPYLARRVLRRKKALRRTTRSLKRVFYRYKKLRFTRWRRFAIGVRYARNWRVRSKRGGWAFRYRERLFRPNRARRRRRYRLRRRKPYWKALRRKVAQFYGGRAFGFGLRRRSCGERFDRLHPGIYKKPYGAPVLAAHLRKKLFTRKTRVTFVRRRTRVSAVKYKHVRRRKKMARVYGDRLIRRLAADISQLPALSTQRKVLINSTLAAHRGPVAWALWRPIYRALKRGRVRRRLSVRIIHSLYTVCQQTDPRVRWSRSRGYNVYLRYQTKAKRLAIIACRNRHIRTRRLHLRATQVRVTRRRYLRTNRSANVRSNPVRRTVRAIRRRALKRLVRHNKPLGCLIVRRLHARRLAVHGAPYQLKRTFNFQKRTAVKLRFLAKFVYARPAGRWSRRLRSRRRGFKSKLKTRRPRVLRFVATAKHRSLLRVRLFRLRAVAKLPRNALRRISSRMEASRYVPSSLELQSQRALTHSAASRLYRLIFIKPVSYKSIKLRRAAYRTGMRKLRRCKVRVQNRAFDAGLRPLLLKRLRAFRWRLVHLYRRGRGKRKLLSLNTRTRKRYKAAAHKGWNAEWEQVGKTVISSGRMHTRVSILRYRSLAADHIEDQHNEELTCAATKLLSVQ